MRCGRLTKCNTDRLASEPLDRTRCALCRATIRRRYLGLRDDPAPSSGVAQGIGRAILRAALDVARAEGASHMDLGTSEDDEAARALYESEGFDCHEGKGSGPLSLFYEREL